MLRQCLRSCGNNFSPRENNLIDIQRLPERERTHTLSAPNSPPPPSKLLQKKALYWYSSWNSLVSRAPCGFQLLLNARGNIFCMLSVVWRGLRRQPLVKAVKIITTAELFILILVFWAFQHWILKYFSDIKVHKSISKISYLKNYLRLVCIFFLVMFINQNSFLSVFYNFFSKLVSTHHTNMWGEGKLG